MIKFDINLKEKSDTLTGQIRRHHMILSDTDIFANAVYKPIMSYTLPFINIPEKNTRN